MSVSHTRTNKHDISTEEPFMSLSSQHTHMQQKNACIDVENAHIHAARNLARLAQKTIVLRDEILKQIRG